MFDMSLLLDYSFDPKMVQSGSLEIP